MTRLFKIFLLIFTFSFFGCEVEDLVLKPPRAHCGKIVGFHDPNTSQEQGNPCGDGYRDSDGIWIPRSLPGNGSYGIIVVNDISANEKTFCVNSSVAVTKRLGGIGTIYCDRNYTTW